MDRFVFDNPVKSYLFFLLVFFSGIIVSFAVYLLTRNNSKTIVKRMKSIVIILIVSISIHIGTSFFDISTDVYHVLFTIAKILYVVSFTWLFIKASYIGIERVYRISHIKESMSLTSQIIGLLKKVSFFFVSVMGFSMILNILGFNVFSILTGLGIGGLAVALGAQEIMANLFGGLTIFLSGFIKVGDFVEIDQHSGFVSEIGLRTTKLKRLDSKTVIIPNSQVIKSAVVNHTMGKSVMLSYVIPLKYSLSAEKVKRASDIVNEILQNDIRIADKKSIGVGFYKFDTYALNLYVSFAINDMEKSGEIKEDFHYMVKHKFDTEKIEIAYPTQTVEIVNK